MRGADQFVILEIWKAGERSRVFPHCVFAYGLELIATVFHDDATMNASNEVWGWWLWER